jgi:hypothetical protein
MIQLRFFTGALITWLVLFLNIERAFPDANIASFVYLYAPFSAVLLLFSPRILSILKPWHLTAGIVAVFFVIKYSLGYRILGDAWVITTAEVAILIFTAYLAKRIALLVHEFEKTVAKLTFQQIGLPPRLYETVDNEELYREVKRCRRFKHPLSLLVVRSQTNSEQARVSELLLEIQKSFAHRYVQARMAKLFSDHLRDSDLVVVQKDGLMILLPETEEQDARRLVEKIRDLALKDTGIDISAGIAEFPNRAVTLSGLIDFAMSSLQQEQAFEQASADSRLNKAQP